MSKRWVALGLGLTLAGCGGSHRAASTSTRTATTAARHAVAFGEAPAHVLVTMRAYSPKSLMWQIVAVRQDGSGVLTTLIGEVTGAARKQFRLPAPAMARLRTLVAGARGIAPPPKVPGDDYDSLFFGRRRSENVQGPAPGPLGGLISFLHGLMLTYCC